MTLVALASLKASPGVTTAAVALGAAWPQGPRVAVAEWDPAGGDLAARYGLADTSGLVSLAAACRHERDPELLWRHAHHLPSGLPVLPAPVGGEQARAALGALATGFAEPAARIAHDPGTVVVADCGRLEPGGAASPLIRRANMLCVLARPVLAELAHLSSAAEGVRAMSDDIALVLVGTGPYTRDEVADVLGMPVRAVLPTDPKAAALLSGETLGSRGQRRLPLLRAAGSLAEDISAATTPRHQPQTPKAGHPEPAQPASPVDGDGQVREHSQPSGAPQ